MFVWISKHPTSLRGFYWRIYARVDAWMSMPPHYLCTLNKWGLRFYRPVFSDGQYASSKQKTHLGLVVMTHGSMLLGYSACLIKTYGQMWKWTRPHVPSLSWDVTWETTHTVKHYFLCSHGSRCVLVCGKCILVLTSYSERWLLNQRSGDSGHGHFPAILKSKWLSWFPFHIYVAQ